MDCTRTSSADIHRTTNLTRLFAHSRLRSTTTTTTSHKTAVPLHHHVIIAKRGITDERAALQEALQKWQQEGLLEGNNKFASGKDDPNLNDLCVYGTLRSVEGLPTHDQVVMEDETNLVLKDWYLRVKERLVDY